MIPTPSLYVRHSNLDLGQAIYNSFPASPTTGRFILTDLNLGCVNDAGTEEDAETTSGFYSHVNLNLAVASPSSYIPTGAAALHVQVRE